MPLLYGIRHAWPEQAGFCLNRRKGYPGYSFVHFLTSVEIVIGGVRTVTPNHTCIIYAPVSYTHLDVYKRQELCLPERESLSAIRCLL